ncbi:membrane protein insertase YidC [Amycolatopsis suaedae]|uniref:Membrane protein insertase YidC n=1 Tax=Amycolatopsis suaedae TaxID=2510978 RepID=A0A4Q7J2C9_9PSEU|nr:membrane protein insertase YidC [Amycolatopsis suaedae]RZQ61049.1 membrane protein insertase YidC [Amycolatopsis suaedae]
MLDFVYYPVSFILWCWHKVFGFIFGEASAASWVIAIVFLTFTVRGIMFKPFVNQVRSMKKMQDFAPELKKVQKRYANDKQRQAMEMQKLQREHGVNPLGSCLPMLLQIPVFIGLNWVLRAFTVPPPGGGPKTENYFFDQAGVESYTHAKLFGVHLSEAIYNGVGLVGGQAGAQWLWYVAPVAIPLMIISSVTTHLNARHSAARQNPATMTPQTAMMQKLTMYVFPLGVLVFGALFPIGLLIYWVANNGWTFMQQMLVYKKIDKEEEEKKVAAREKRNNLAPKPGQKPTAPKPGQKPVQQKKNPASGSGAKQGQQGQQGKRKVTKAGSAHGFAQTAPASDGDKSGDGKPGSTVAKPDGEPKSSQNGSGASGTNGSAPKQQKTPPRKTTRKRR